MEEKREYPISMLYEIPYQQRLMGPLSFNEKLKLKYDDGL